MKLKKFTTERKERFEHEGLIIDPGSPSLAPNTYQQPHLSLKVFSNEVMIALLCLLLHLHSFMKSQIKYETPTYFLLI